MNPNVFRPENWSKLLPNQRRDAFQSLENYMAAVQGRTPRTVEIDNDMAPNINGVYKSRDNKIYLNPASVENSSNPFRYMNTTIHEGRHAYQHDCVEGKIQHNESPQTVQSWKEDFDVYANVDKYNREFSFPKYRYQAVENDANNYANGVMEQLEPYYGNEQKYKDYREDVEAENKVTEAWAKERYGPAYEKIIQNDIHDEYVNRFGEDEVQSNINNNFSNQSVSPDHQLSGREVIDRSTRDYDYIDNYAGKYLDTEKTYGRGLSHTHYDNGELSENIKGINDYYDSIGAKENEQLDNLRLEEIDNLLKENGSSLYDLTDNYVDDVIKPEREANNENNNESEQDLETNRNYSVQPKDESEKENETEKESKDENKLEDESESENETKDEQENQNDELSEDTTHKESEDENKQEDDSESKADDNQKIQDDELNKDATDKVSEDEDKLVDDSETKTDDNQKIQDDELNKDATDKVSEDENKLEGESESENETEDKEENQEDELNEDESENESEDESEKDDYDLNSDEEENESEEEEESQEDELNDDETDEESDDETEDDDYNLNSGEEENESENETEDDYDLGSNDEETKSEDEPEQNDYDLNSEDGESETKSEDDYSLNDSSSNNSSSNDSSEEDDEENTY